MAAGRRQSQSGQAADRLLEPMDRLLSDFKILSFDCYGTLIDWETGIWEALQPLLTRGPAEAVGREQALRAFAAHESRLERVRPELIYPEVLAQVHADVAAEFGLVSTPELDREFGRSVPRWPAFPDSAEALRSLQNRFRLVILSNVDRLSFTASQRRLGIEFDAVYTAQDIGSYKPSMANFEYLIDHVKRDFGRGPDSILHTAQSLYHDHVPARACGLANAWIDRQRLSQNGGWGATAVPDERPQVDFRFFSMAELAAAVRAENG
jgi:2-haloalkanoic acid dehalogenase type II